MTSPLRKWRDQIDDDPLLDAELAASRRDARSTDHARALIDRLKGTP